MIVVKLVKSIMFGPPSSTANRFHREFQFVDGGDSHAAHPTATGRGDTASQYSPRTKTLPSGASSVIADPVSPIMPSLPVTTLLRRARTTSESRSTVMAEKGSAKAMAVRQMDAHFGQRAVDQHDRAQHHRDRAARAENAVRRELSFQNKQAKASSNSAAPSQLIGSTEIAESPSSTIMAPSDARHDQPRAN